MPINSKQLIELLIRPTLKESEMYSLSAEQLIACTCAQESKMGTYIAQIGGPAVGIFQMEPETYKELYEDFYEEKQKGYFADNLIYDFKHAVLFCRLFYLRIRERLPDAGDWNGMALYWKKYYNTELGAGTVEEFIANAREFVIPYYGEK